jgi:hypothetical protein
VDLLFERCSAHVAGESAGGAARYKCADGQKRWGVIRDERVVPDSRLCRLGGTSRSCHARSVFPIPVADRSDAPRPSDRSRLPEGSTIYGCNPVVGRMGVVMRYLPLLIALLPGCSLQQVNDAFELPMLEYECQYGDCGEDWSTGDFALYARLESQEWIHGSRDVMDDDLPQSFGRTTDKPYDVTRLEKDIENVSAIRSSGIRKASSPFGAYEGAYSQFLFSTPCLDFSHRAFNLIAKSKYEPGEMRVVTILLNDETLDRRGGPRFGYGQDKHAMLLVDGTVYDNGYLSDAPFAYEYSSTYGREIDNVWSPKAYR